MGGVYWVYLDNPYFSPYVPFYAGVTTTRRMLPNLRSRTLLQEESARWAIDFVDNLAGLRFQNAIEDVRAVRDPWEEKMFARQAEVEAEAVRLHGQDPTAACDYLTRYCIPYPEEPAHVPAARAIITKYTNNRE